MEPQEIRNTAECPSCKWQVSFYLSEFRGCLKLYCNRCNQMMIEWEYGKAPKIYPKKEAEKKPVPTVSEEAPHPSSSTGDNTQSTPESGSDAVISINKPPERVGQYQLIQLIGQGTVGEIYLAKHTSRPTQVAIKLLSQRMQKDNIAVDRFLQEARVHSRLDHPNIVRIEDVGYCPNSKRLYLVMEYVEGESLEKILTTRGKLSQKHALKIAIAVAHALEHALNQKIIHRDLKPGNILIDKRSRRVKVTDLGLGKIVEEKGATLDGELMGTAYYMPPEQIRNAKEVDHRADIYALGATLYNMLAGRPPYGEVKGTLNILKAKISHEPIPIKEYDPDVSDAVASIVAKAMARDRNLRYSTPTEMLQDMQNALNLIKAENL